MDFSLQVPAHVPMYVVLPLLSFRGSDSPFLVDLSCIWSQICPTSCWKRTLFTYVPASPSSETNWREHPRGRLLKSIDCMVARTTQSVFQVWWTGYVPGSHLWGVTRLDGIRVFVSRCGLDRLQEGPGAIQAKKVARQEFSPRTT